MVILAFFILHWQVSVFFQSFFLHRYGAHKQFTMSKRTERVFHFLTWVAQGSSYLSPRGYAILHRMHHAFSDTARDPHSPHFAKTPIGMMMNTIKVYSPLTGENPKAEARFLGNYPEWKALDNFADRWTTRILWGALYTFFYMKFATAPWMYALLPIHWLMGPIHGAIVNWGGHKYGYRNYDTKDKSVNTLVFDVLTAGELFQNNHHTFGMSPNFAARWFEIDPTYQVIKVFSALGFIDTSKSQKIRYPAKHLPPAYEPSVLVPVVAATGPVEESGPVFVGDVAASVSSAEENAHAAE